MAEMSNRDPNQIHQFEHDDKINARRVVVVGNELSLDTAKLSESLEKAVKEGLKGLSETDFSKSQAPAYTPIEIEKTVFLPQMDIKTVEIPVIVKETQFKEIEKPIFIDRIIEKIVEKPIFIDKVVTVETPVIIKEIEYKEFKEFSKHKLAAIIRDICMLGLMIYHLFSHIK
jgi:hypothetical protein